MWFGNPMVTEADFIVTAFLLAVHSPNVAVGANAIGAGGLPLDSDNVTELPNPTEPSGDAVPYRKEQWMEEALKDVAYYLRSYKFNEFDRRFHKTVEESSQGFYSSYPDPPLRNLHWEVHRNCILGIAYCVRYIQKMARRAALHREDDSAVVVEEQGWKEGSPWQRGPIKEAEEECRTLYKRDLSTGAPFDGPLERFQWRTTASYFMCWYTMLREPALETIGQRCDNYASCMDPTNGARNQDYRAVGPDGLERPFACAQYSFCPDPCCPGKHYATEKLCTSDPKGPCWGPGGAGSRCLFPAEENTDLEGIIHNRWNVSCNCSASRAYYRNLTASEGGAGPRAEYGARPGTALVLREHGGFEWQSRFAMCTDVDECSIGSDDCHRQRESCHNLPGGYACRCRFGFAAHPLPPPATEMILERGKLDLQCLRDKRLQAAGDIVDAIRGIKEGGHHTPPATGRKFGSLFGKLARVFGWSGDANEGATTRVTSSGGAVQDSHVALFATLLLRFSSVLFLGIS